VGTKFGKLGVFHGRFACFSIPFLTFLVLRLSPLIHRLCFLDQVLLARPMKPNTSGPAR